MKYLFLVLILFLPSQLGKHWWPEWSLVDGVRVDYSNGNYKSEIRHQISDIKTPLCFYLIYDFLYLIYYLAITTAVAGGVLGGEVLGNSAGGVGDCKISGFRFQI